MEKDSENLRLLVSLWDEGGGSPQQPFYRGSQEVAGRPRMVAGSPAHGAIAPLHCPKDVAVELKSKIVEGKGGKEGEHGRPVTNLCPIGHAWPPLNSYFHAPLHLAPIMLTPLTKSIKSKANSFHPFSKFFLFIFDFFLDFILCNDEINMLWKKE
jgi:hypothetical protein